MQNTNFHFSAHKSNFPDKKGRQRNKSKGIKQNKKMEADISSNWTRTFRSQWKKIPCKSAEQKSI